MRLRCIFCVGIVFAARVYSATSSAVILRIQSDIQAGNIAVAQRELTAALRSDSRNGGLYNLQGIIQATRGETAKAAESFSLATELSPELVNAYLNLGRACEMLSEHDA